LALFKDALEGGAGTGLAIVGGAALALTVVPAIAQILRPVAKAAIKGGIVFYRETVVCIGCAAEDLIAEARAELEAEGDQAAGRNARPRVPRAEQPATPS
jgi:hypothetical protein